MKCIESIKEFDGYLSRYTHDSIVCDCEMTFSVFMPMQAKSHKVPSLYWLSGLTCNDDNARVKAGAQRYAAEQGIALIFPDTSPRGELVEDRDDRYDLGQGAGFYVNATQEPWKINYQMFDYISYELPALVENILALIPDAKSISGHSMGGHGALICALKNPTNFRSVSAFAPICNPVKSAWGKSCFSEYLGDDSQVWRQYDATCLVEDGAKLTNILIDQGLADEFYNDKQLLPENFETACEQEGQKLNLRLHEGYDHSYHFISTFIGEHITYHANALKNSIKNMDIMKLGF